MPLDPWGNTLVDDYERLCQEFGIEKIETVMDDTLKKNRYFRRCIIFGHLTRMAVWNLRKSWDRSLPTAEKLGRFAHAIMQLADAEQLLEQLPSVKQLSFSPGPLFAAAESTERTFDAVAF